VNELYFVQGSKEVRIMFSKFVKLFELTEK